MRAREYQIVLGLATDGLTHTVGADLASSAER
jgi:hypothetical protein